MEKNRGSGNNSNKMDIISGILVIDCGKDPWELTKEELSYIPKPLLLRHWSDAIPYLWSKLPEHIRRDAEVASYRLCRDHWPASDLNPHLDGYPPTKRECAQCQQDAYEDESNTAPSPSATVTPVTTPHSDEKRSETPPPTNTPLTLTTPSHITHL